MLELIGVTKQYLYGARLFGALDARFGDGEIIAVYGGEGSGKTSLLKTVAGAEEYEGRILLDGEPVKLKSDDTVMVFSDGAVFGWRTVFDNLAYPLKIRKMDKVEIASKVIRAAEKAGIGACLNFRARSLSAAERRRMSLARLFVRDARLVLADEIAAGLNREDAAAVWEDFAPLLQELAAGGATVMYATSDRAEALGISDRIIVLQGGEVKQIGSAEEIRRTPRSVWAAQALDARYNVLKCRLAEENGGLSLVFSDGTRLGAENMRGHVAESYIGKDVLCGWYPSDCEGGGKGIFSGNAATVRRDVRGWLLGTEEGLYALTDEKKEHISVLPRADGITLFDAANEYSVMV